MLNGRQPLSALLFCFPSSERGGGEQKEVLKYLSAIVRQLGKGVEAFKRLLTLPSVAFIWHILIIY